MKGFVSISALLAVLLQLGTSASAIAQTPSNNAQASKQVPDYVIYEFYFHKIAFFNNLAQQKEQSGLSGGGFQATIINELGINQTQYGILNQIAAQALAQAAAMDANAATIIQQERARYPQGKLASKNQYPPLPPELTTLQASRNSIILNAINQLSQQLGQAAFQNIDSRIKALVTPSVNLVPVNP